VWRRDLDQFVQRSTPVSLLIAERAIGEIVQKQTKEREDDLMSNNLTAVLQELLQNASNLKVLSQRMTPDATYVSLNFDNPELKKVMPWTGTHKGPQALLEVFGAIQRFWKTLDFKVTDTIQQGSRVAFFGSFTYKSNTTGKEITSPFGLLARFEGDKVAYIQFLEDSYGTAGSFKTGGATQDSTAIPREKRFESKPSKSSPLVRWR
jgi:uncharacterized protein